MAETVIFPARRIVTIDADVPEASAVAVRDGRILSVGSADEVADRVSRWGGDVRTDTSFSDLVLVPGLHEAHSHVQMEGALWGHTYVGGDDRLDPDGTRHPAVEDVDDTLARLTDFRKPGEPVVGWCHDPAQTDDRPLTRTDLDGVATDVPVLVLNRSLHIGYANSKLLDEMGALDGPAPVEGIIADRSGVPTGELHELQALGLGMFNTPGFIDSLHGPDAVLRGARLAHRVGATTTSDMLAGIDAADTFRVATDADDFPVRISISPGASAAIATIGLDETLRRIEAIDVASFGERLLMGPVKLMVDGSIQGFTAAIGWPGYCGGDDHTQLNYTAEQIAEQVALLHGTGRQVAIHTNGDEATRMAIDAIEAALAGDPRPDHRHRLEHCQMATRADFERMRTLGVGANLFANHLWHWGDVHHDQTVGPDRAARMNACATAETVGIDWSIHSDSPVTPIDPLFTIWCAVNRVTKSGRVLGPRQRVGGDVALRAMTLGSARLIKRDRELGSITPGKLADFTVLADDPTTVEAESIKDIEVWGTVVGGRVQPLR